MKYLTKATIAKEVSDTSGFSLNDCIFVVNKVLEIMASGVSKGKKMQIRGFGTWECRLRKARVRSRPGAKNETVEVPAHFAVVFKPSDNVKRAVRRLAKVD